jgi:nucleoside-diphosphate-sugar epimerase
VAAPSHDLLAIGAGHLGGRVLRLWCEAHGPSSVLAETRSDRRHAELRALGVGCRCRSDETPSPRSHVLFCVPPSSTEDYTAEARRAVQLRDGRGRLVMTSSTAVYAEEDGGVVDEGSPLASTERALRLLAAEETVRTAGGIVIRLAGLYDQERGPHRVFLRQGRSPRRGDGLLNLIHYDDAAELCRLALERGEAGAVYLGNDDRPITRRELVEAAALSGRFEGGCVFTGTGGPLGRRCDGAATRRRLGWEPRHRTFPDWLSR